MSFVNVFKSVFSLFSIPGISMKTPLEIAPNFLKQRVVAYRYINYYITIYGPWKGYEQIRKAAGYSD